MLFAYISWHYGKGLRAAVAIARNFIAFAMHLFSIRELARSLFSPWKQITEEYRGQGLNTTFLWAIWGNLLSRILGAIARSSLLILGLFFLAFVALSASIFLAFWAIGPLLPPVLLVVGVMLL